MTRKGWRKRQREGVEIGHSKIRRGDREKRKTEMRARGGKERKGFDLCMCSLAIMRDCEMEERFQSCVHSQIGRAHV